MGKLKIKMQNGQYCGEMVANMAEAFILQGSAKSYVSEACKGYELACTICNMVREISNQYNVSVQEVEDAYYSINLTMSNILSYQRALDESFDELKVIMSCNTNLKSNLKISDNLKESVVVQAKNIENGAEYIKNEICKLIENARNSLSITGENELVDIALVLHTSLLELKGI